MKTTTQPAGAMPVGIPEIPKLQSRIPEYIIILRELIASIDNRQGARNVFNRAVDTGFERTAEARLKKADRRFSNAMRAARNFTADEGF